MSGIPWVAILIDLFLTALIAFPLCDYLLHGWFRKESEVSNSLTDEAKQIYLKTFHRIEVSPEAAVAAFKKLYTESFGRHRFAAPMVFILAVALAENYILAHALTNLPSTPKQFSPYAAAIAGAYTFVSWDFFCPDANAQLIHGGY